jgi:hypothetical protein
MHLPERSICQTMLESIMIVRVDRKGLLMHTARNAFTHILV